MKHKVSMDFKRLALYRLLRCPAEFTFQQGQHRIIVTLKGFTRTRIIRIEITIKYESY